MTQTPLTRRFRWLAGDGEMVRRVREIDWSQTSMGPVEHWPAALRISFTTCLDCAFPMIIWWGPELAFFYNEEYRPSLGAKHPSALGQPGATVWPEIWDVIGPMLTRVLQHGEATRSRDLCLHIERHGYLEETYWSFSYSPILDDDGAIGGVFCPVIETTEKVIAERRLRTLRDLAAECKGLHDETAVYAAAARVLATNAQDIPFAAIYRIDADDALAVLEAAVGVDAGAEAAPLRIALDTPSTRGWSLGLAAYSAAIGELDDLPSRFDRLPNGPWATPAHRALVLPLLLPGQERARAVLVAAVSPMRALCADYRTYLGLVASQIASGLADAQALEEERRRSRALAEIDRAKTAFFSNVSHEFRTPLTLILGPIGDALAEPEAPWPRERIELIHRNAQRLQKLVNALLDFSRIEAGRMKASYEPTALAEFTRELASAFRSAIEKAGMQLRVDCTELDEPVYVDRDMYEKIVLNLMSNAFKFTLEGQIEVRLADHGATVTLSVSDTGTGIAAEQLPHVFERFHRIEGARARTHEGTGIGLALVRELARLHGGDVTVDSIVGCGSTFTVTLPKGRQHLPADRIGSLPPRAATASAESYLQEARSWLPAAPVGADDLRDSGDAATDVPSTTRTRIVWADDNADMRDYVTRLLAPLYDVDAVADGEAALAAVQREPADLVLSDVMLPRLDGFGLLRALRADPRTQTLPVILLSARAGEEAKVEGLQAGADDYLVKPFSAQELLARIGAHLATSRLRREHEAHTVADLAAMKRLYDVADRCARVGSDPQHCLDTIVEAAIELVGADNAHLQTVDPDSGSSRIAAQRGLDAAFLAFFDAVRADDRSAGAAALRTGECQIVEDVAQSSLFDGPSREAMRAAGARSVLSMPLLDGAGAVLGLLSTGFAAPHRPDARQLRLIGLLAQHAADYLARRRSESATRESEERFRAFTSATSDVVYRMSSDWTEMRYLQGREFVADTLEPTLVWLDRYIHPDDQQRVTETIRQAVATRSVFELEHRVIRVDGSPGWAHSRAVPILDERGEIVEWFGAASDVNQRKRAEEALQLSELRYRTLFDSIDEGYCIIRVLFDAAGTPYDYHFEEVNQSFERQTGLRDVAGRSMRDIAPTHETHWYEIYGRIALTGRPERFVHVASALQRWYDVYAYRIGEPGENRVAVLFHDISERKQIEEALRVSERRLRAIIEQLPVGVVVTDEGGRWTLSNARMAEYVADAVSPRPSTAVTEWRAWDERGDPIPPEDWPARRALRGETVTPGLEMHRSTDAAQGSWMRVSAAPLRNDDIVVGACVVVQDVTELKNAEHALREADRRKDEFLATLAHELRNPLAPIRNGLKILRLATEDRAAAARVYEMLERQVNHMIRLVDDLLEVSRITGGKIELRREVLELTAVLRGAVETSRPLIEAAGHRLTLSMPAEPLLIDADPTRVTQIVANLLNNAAKYMDDGGQIWLAVQRDGGDAVISVRDSGIGIPAAMLPKVFDLFTQVERTYERAQGGLGIGLTLVRSLVEMHGGRVEARSDGDGKGSEFVVRVPLAATAYERTPPPQAAGAASPAAQHRILVVDDNRDAADSLGMLLSLFGAEVHIAHDGAAGLGVLQAEQPTVVLLDIGMPGMDGYEFARRARRLPAGAAATLIALTGWGQDEDRRRSADAGIDHHLVKPVDVDALERLLAAVAARPQ